MLAVPHTGRDYPAPLLAAARVPVAVLRSLEDRYADLLVVQAAARGYPVLVASAPRALVDLNRDPDDRTDRPADDHGAQTQGKARSRAAAGMGVFPESIASVGALWRNAPDSRELDDRIARIHRPYHAALERTLGDARGRHGAALLLDIHSMPRRAGRGWPRSADIVFGDRKGVSAAKHLVRAAEEVVGLAGLSCARNTPYAGGYGTIRHGRPDDQIHAIQVEVARDLYLDADGAPVGAGVDRIACLIAAIADTLDDALCSLGRRDAAE